jgi:hypothetical protein
LGAKIIRESMAYLCQSLFDIDYELKSEFPYKIVDYLCEAKFKNIAGDTKKIIAICYISLFSMRPAEVLVDYLFMANHNLDIDYWGLFDIFLSCNIENNGVDYSIEAFLISLWMISKGFLRNLQEPTSPFLSTLLITQGLPFMRLRYLQL